MQLIEISCKLFQLLFQLFSIKSMLKLAFLLWSSEIKWKSFQGLVSQKLFQGSLSHELSPTFRLLPLSWLNEMTILSKESKPDNFESRDSLKLNFTNIRGLLSNFVGCESFLESNSPNILAYCETNLDGSIDSGNIFRLFQNNSLICMTL